MQDSPHGALHSPAPSPGTAVASGGGRFGGFGPQGLGRIPAQAHGEEQEKTNPLVRFPWPGQREGDA